MIAAKFVSLHTTSISKSSVLDVLTCIAYSVTFATLLAVIWQNVILSFVLSMYYGGASIHTMLPCFRCYTWFVGTHAIAPDLEACV